jgi:hypothetical protein
MSQCEFCNYYFSSEKKPNTAVCEFTGDILINDTRKNDADYFCSTMSYSDYLNKSKPREEKIIMSSKMDLKML